MQDEQSNTKPEWAKTKADLRRERGEKPSRIGWVVAAVLIIGGGGFAAYSMKPADDALSTVEEVKIDYKYLAAAEVQTIKAHTLQQQIKVTGTVQPQNISQLPALISAQVEQVNVRPGDAVTQGDLLVAMDTENLLIQKQQQLAAIKATEAQLSLAESQLKRTQDLFKQGIAPSSQLEQARSTVDAQKANLQAQQSQIKATDYQLRNAKIYAPVNGVVSARQVEPGAFVGVGSPLLEVVDLSVMEMVVSVSTSDSARIVQGMTVDLSIEGLPQAVVSGTVSRISPVANRGTRTIPVFIEISNTSQALRGGMFAIGVITLAAKDDGISVPQSAIRYHEDGESYVLRIEDGKALEQPVELGALWGERQRVEVTRGLAEGDQIIVLPLVGLSAGDAVALIGE